MSTMDTDAAAAVHPRWVMLNHHGHGRSYCYPADAKNSLATCLSSAGKRIQASFRLTAPPGNSALFLDWPDVPGLDEFQGTEVIAAHGDSVLIQARDCSDNLASSAPSEYFVYRARAGGPPSMSRLPPCYLRMPWDTRDSRRRRREPRTMDSTDTGLLRRGVDELAVAQLSVCSSLELCVLRFSSGRLEWETNWPSVIYPDDARGDEVNQHWETDAIVPIGDRFLCWIDYFCGLLLCDVLDDEPMIRFVPLPVEPNLQRHRRNLERPFKNARNIGTTAGGAVRFVSVDHRCCCGGLLESTCPRSRFFFTLTTWTLDMDTMTWTTDGVLGSDEFWALPGYEDLPRVTPEFPVLSMDDADAVCLMVRHYGLDAPDDGRIWMIKVDTRTKTLLSVVRYNTARYKPMDDDDDGNDDDDDGQSTYHQVLLRRRRILLNNDESQDHFDNIGFIPSEISKYLN